MVRGNVNLWQHYAGFLYGSSEYYKGFNNSIGTFGGVLQHINGKHGMGCTITRIIVDLGYAYRFAGTCRRYEGEP